jgi:hypothetical protein
MMSVNAVFHLTVLAVGTRVEASQEGDRVEFVLCRLVLVLEAAGLSLGTWSSQVVVVAEFVVFFSSFNAVQSRLGNLNGGVQTAGARIPSRRFWRRRCRTRLVGGTGGLWLKRKRHLGWRRASLDNSSGVASWDAGLAWGGSGSGRRGCPDRGGGRGGATSSRAC